jgi:flagellar biosynthesis protein FlhG
LQIAAGAWASKTREVSRVAQRRLIDQLRRLGNYADVILLDVGCGNDEGTLHYWQAADRVLLVTTPDSVAVMDAYAAIKVATMHDVMTDVELIVNQTVDAAQAASVQRRIDHSCQRFLGLHVTLAGDVPLDAQLAHAARQQNLLALSPDASRAVQSIEELVAERDFAGLAAA